MVHRSAITKKGVNQFGQYVDQFGQYVAFGYNAVDNRVFRLGGFVAFADAKTVATQSHYVHKGVAKVTHPQKVWFWSCSQSAWIPVDENLTLDIMTLLGV